MRHGRGDRKMMPPADEDRELWGMLEALDDLDDEDVLNDWETSFVADNIDRGEPTHRGFYSERQEGVIRRLYEEYC